MSQHWRYVVGLGVVLVVAVAIAAAVSSHGSDGAESASEPPVARHSSRTARGANWVGEANAVCMLGRKLDEEQTAAAGRGSPPG